MVGIRRLMGLCLAPLACLLAAGCIAPKAPIIGTQGQAAYASKADLRVLSYNTYYVFSHGSEIAAATEWIRSQAPDVVALQELTDIEESRLTELATGWGHPHSALLKTSGFSVGLTSTRPIEVVDRMVDGLHHGCLHARVDGVHVFVVHLSPFEWTVREREAALILGALKGPVDGGEDVLVLGDFNALSSADRASIEAQPELLVKALASDAKHDHVENLRAERFDFAVMDRFFSAGLADVVLPFLADKPADRSTFTTGIWTDEKSTPPTGGMRIDFILGSMGLADRARAAWIPREGVLNRTSDHYPVLVEFERRR